MNLTEWQKAYPYIVNKSTGIKLGDYEDAHRKFQKVWAGANPYSGTPLNWSQWDAGRIEQGYTPTAEDYQANREYGDWEKAKEEAWSKMLTPEQLNEYYSQKHDSYKKHQRMGQMAFLAAAGAMAAPGLIGAMGAEGAGVGGAAAAGGDLGMAGWIPETAGAWSEAGMGLQGGLGSFIPGVDSAASGYGFASEIPAWAQGSAGAGWTGGMGSTVGNSLSGSIGEYLKSLGTSAAKNVGGNWLSQLISSGTNAYMGNRSAGQYNDVLNEINALYSPNSPYALQMKQALARKDAAAGRNSQYGTREVELAAALTNSKANALTSAGYGNLMNQRGISQNIPWNGFLAALGSGPGQELITKAGGNIGGWLGGLFGNSGDKLVPTQPNSTPNWWENWGGYTNGGP